jgi:co-chaperonin GroES (HSP10)
VVTVGPRTLYAKAGDIVYFNPCRAIKVVVDDRKHLLIPEKDVLAVIP